MSTTTGRALTGLARGAFHRGIFINNFASTVRLNSVRSIAVSSQRSAKHTVDDQEVKNEPIKFSTSKASHRTWKIDRAMGSDFERPWWKVLPVSLVCTVFLLWCALREETEIDAHLEKHLYEHLPGLLSDKEEEEEQSKSS